MTTFIDALPKERDVNEQEVFPLNPAGYYSIGDYIDGVVSVEWFKTVFPNIANDELPLSQENYTALKNIGDCWAINAINWRKGAVIEVEGIAADALIDEEEAFLTTMYPPAPEPETEEQQDAPESTESDETTSEGEAPQTEETQQEEEIQGA